MAESNQNTRRGLPGGSGPKPPEDPPTQVTTPNPPIPKEEKKKSVIPVIILVVTGLAVFSGIGWLLWSNEQGNAQKRTEIDQKYLKIKESIPQIDKDIANAKNLGDLKNLDVKLSQSGKDLDTLKNQAEQIGYSNGLDSIKADIETSKTSSVKLNSRIAIENNANVIIKDAKDSVSSFLKLDSPKCDELKSAESKFSEAIAKLNTVPAQTFASAESQKLAKDYTGLKNRAIDQYKVCTAPVPPSPIDDTVKPYISDQPDNGGSSNPTNSVQPSNPKPRFDAYVSPLPSDIIVEQGGVVRRAP